MNIKFRHLWSLVMCVGWMWFGLSCRCFALLLISHSGENFQTSKKSTRMEKYPANSKVLQEVWETIVYSVHIYNIFNVRDATMNRRYACQLKRMPLPECQVNAVAFPTKMDRCAFPFHITRLVLSLLILFCSETCFGTCSAPLDPAYTPLYL